MCKILFSPVEEIRVFKKHKRIGKSFLYLLYALIIGLVSAMIFSLKLGVQFSNAVLYSLVGVVVLFVLVLFNAFLFKTVFWVLKGKCNFFASLTAICFSCFVWSVGLFVALLLNFIPKAGFVLSALVLSVTLILAVSVKIKSVMELFEVDLVTSVFACGLVLSAVFIMVYVVLVLVMVNSGLGLMGPAMMGAY
jgi:hypothetical protein